MSLAGWWRRARWRLYAPVYHRLASPFERGPRAVNPVARLLFSDVTRKVEPLVAGTSLAVGSREWVLCGLYGVAILKPAEQFPRHRRRAAALA